MSVLITILAIVLALPVLVVVGIALGPAILVILLMAAWALPVLWANGAWLRHTRDKRG